MGDCPGLGIRNRGTPVVLLDPAAACFLRRPGDSVFRAFKLDVLRVRDGQVAETTTFDSALFGALGLPEVLAGDGP